MDPVNQNQDELLQELFISACEDHQAGNIQKAKEGYLKILEIADNPLLRYNLGLIYFDEGHFEQARDSFKAADSLHGGDVDTLFNLALSCKKSGQTEEAARIYTRIVSLDPQHIDALYNLAGCYREVACDERPRR